MSRWSSQQQEEEVDFEQLLSGGSALQLLAHPNIVEEVKSRTTKFTQRLVHPKHRTLLFQLIDIALTPRAFMQAHGAVVDRAATHAAIEVLSSLSEEFMEEVFEGGEEEDAVVQGEREYPILGQLLRVVGQAGAEETALAYFNKLLTPFLYQRSEQIIRLAPQLLLPALLNYFHNQSVAELFAKLLEAENEKDFFEAEKADLVGALCRALADESDAERAAVNAESFAGFAESLVEKHEDKYEKTKYARLIRTILERGQAFLFLFALFDRHQGCPRARLPLLRAIDALLRLHLPAKQQSRLSQEDEPLGDGCPLHPQLLEGLRGWLGRHMVHEFVSDSRLELLAYYKLVRSALTVQPTLVEGVLSQAFLAQTLRFMRADPENNILHNHQREVLVLGVRESDRARRTLQEELGLEQLVRSTITERNSTSCLHNQLFLLSEAIRATARDTDHLTESWSQLGSLIDNKRQFYSALIGGNPRGEDKWDSLIDNDNEMILRSLQKDGEGEKEKETIEEPLELPEKKIMIQLASGLEDLGGTEVLSEEEDDPFTSAPASDAKNKHFFDFELPLDSDKEESDPQNRSNSLDDIPIVIKIDSTQEQLRLSNNLRSSSSGNEELKRSASPRMEVVVEDPLIEQTTQIVIEESFKEEEPSRAVYYCREEVQTALRNKYGLTLKPAPLLPPLSDEVGRMLLTKYGLSLQREQRKAERAVRDEVESLLWAKYGLRLK